MSTIELERGTADLLEEMLELGMHPRVFMTCASGKKPVGEERIQVFKGDLVTHEFTWQPCGYDATVDSCWWHVEGVTEPTYHYWGRKCRTRVRKDTNLVVIIAFRIKYS